MAAKILNGKYVAEKIRHDLSIKVKNIKDKTGRVPGLAVVLVGDDPASKTYVSMKEKACKQVGIYSEVYKLKADAQEHELLKLIHQLNSDEKIDGILVQLPLPGHIDEKKIIDAIKPEKDVDGFHPVNIGKLLINEKGFIPCTPYGIIKLMDYYGIEIEGKNAVVVGRSNIVGKPLAVLLLHRNATVTICHSRTKNLPDITKKADILVAAVGKARIITSDMVKEGAVVIDVGINRIEGKLRGDVDYEKVKEKASWITPVPGGVGPMTITMLLNNTIEAIDG